MVSPSSHTAASQTQTAPTETRVTVVIPFCDTYTPQHMLDSAVESVTQQVDVETDVLVIDDDDEFGPAWARNVGLDRADTRYVAFLDADDEWLQTKLRDQLRTMARTGAGLCVDGSTEYSTQEFIRALAIGETFGLTSSIIIDTEQTDARFDESLERREDHLFMIEAANDAGVCFVEKTFIDGTHEDGLSHHVDSSPRQIERFYWEVCKRVPEAKQFSDAYYQHAYVYLGRSRHFDREYRQALGYFFESMRYGLSLDAVGATGLTLLALARDSVLHLGRRILPRGLQSRIGSVVGKDSR